jgi:FGGY-family pentulose kinase
VGTGSVRAGVVCCSTGTLVASATQAIRTWSTPSLPDHKEQSSEDIWTAAAVTIATAVSSSRVPPASICGLSFDATCSLVLLSSTNTPISACDPSLPDAASRNVILWADHRALPEAASINALSDPAALAALSSVGGCVSPEMELPKLLWLKRNMPAAFKAVNEGRAMDLADYLLYRATGYSPEAPRSLCTALCKWNFSLSTKWDRSFHALAGFSPGDLPDSCIGAPSSILPPGAAASSPLPSPSPLPPLLPGTKLGVGIIDAHAGGIGVLGGRCATPLPPLPSRLALIAGTSACLMFSSKEALFVPGVWGPYRGAMIASQTLNEAGQSAAGSLLDHVLRTHSVSASVADIKATLNTMAERQGVSAQELTRDLHVTPDNLGNRSPLADPTMRGGIVGLGMGEGVEELALLYLATVQALAYQTRHIIDVVEGAGHEKIEAVFVCGGLTKVSAVASGASTKKWWASLGQAGRREVGGGTSEASAAKECLSAADVCRGRESAEPGGSRLA